MEDSGNRKTGPKLTTHQRSVVVRVIAQYHEIRAVQEVLASEYPDVPTLSDRMLRSYRRRIEIGEIIEGVAAARAEALMRGAARREVRISALLRHLSRIDRQLTTAPDAPAFVSLSREYRETLKSLREETQRYELGPTRPASSEGDESVDELSAGELPAVSGSLVDFVADLLARRTAKRPEG